MKRLLTLSLIALSMAALAACGDGAIKRHLTMSGVYSVCKPDGYDVVCFLDADGTEGGLFCMPLSQVGGKCM